MPTRLTGTILSCAARSDAFTGSVPNTIWGYGKVDARLALPGVPALQVLYPSRGTSVTSRYTRTDILQTGGTFDSIRVDLSLDGCSYSKYISTLRSVPSGTPIQVSYTATDTTSRARIRAIGYKGSFPLLSGTVEAHSDGLFGLNLSQTADVENDSSPQVPVLTSTFHVRGTVDFQVPPGGAYFVLVAGDNSRVGGVLDSYQTVVQAVGSPGFTTVGWDYVNSPAGKVTLRFEGVEPRQSGASGIPLATVPGGPTPSRVANLPESWRLFSRSTPLPHSHSRGRTFLVQRQDLELQPHRPSTKERGHERARAPRIQPSARRRASSRGCSSSLGVQP